MLIVVIDRLWSMDMDWTRRLPFRFVGNRRRPTLAKIWIGLALRYVQSRPPADGGQLHAMQCKPYHSIWDRQQLLSWTW
jgi:hypothetical protein